MSKNHLKRPIELPSDVYGDLGMKPKDGPALHGNTGCSSTADRVRTIWFLQPRQMGKTLKSKKEKKSHG